MISIITPTMNSGKYIKNCIEGVRRQNTKHEIEHIIVDNLSYDETGEIVGSYPDTQQNKIIYIREKDEGHHDAISKGIAMAKGDYIGVCNASDFYSFIKWFEVAIERINKDNVDCVYSLTKVVDEDSLLFAKGFGCIAKLQDGRGFLTDWNEYLYGRNGFNECSAIFKAEAIKFLMPMTEIHCPWLDIQFKFYKAGFTSFYFPLPAATTLLHGDSLANINGKEIEKKAFEKLYERIKVEREKIGMK